MIFLIDFDVLRISSFLSISWTVQGPRNICYSLCQPVCSISSGHSHPGL